jgi:hypothetical protein
MVVVVFAFAVKGVRAKESCELAARQAVAPPTSGGWGKRERERKVTLEAT